MEIPSLKACLFYDQQSTQLYVQTFDRTSGEETGILLADEWVLSVFQLDIWGKCSPVEGLQSITDKGIVAFPSIYRLFDAEIEDEEDLNFHLRWYARAIEFLVHKFAGKIEYRITHKSRLGFDFELCPAKSLLLPSRSSKRKTKPNPTLKTKETLDVTS